MDALRNFLESRAVEWAVTALIVVNAVTLGLERITNPGLSQIA